MSTHSPFAFGSLDDRAAAGQHADPPDRISLRNHVVEVEIGAFQVERGTTQRVTFDVVVEVVAPKAPLNDDVDRILSYETLVEAIAIELAAERLNLLETLAERIADRILHAPQATRVFLRIQKLDLGPGALGVEIVRSKDGSDAHTLASIEEPVPHPLVVFLSNKAVASARLSTWLDELQAIDKPVIICVGPPNTDAPKSAAGAAQRRIDLLAIDQNAWVLAGRDRRCLVVNTKSEFEWAARNRKMSVWAPSKIVLDAVEGPTARVRKSVELVHWFAELMEAERMIVVDATPLQSRSLPVAAVALDEKIL